MSEQQPEDDPEVIRAGNGNAYPEHVMTATDVKALIPKEVD